MSAMTADGLELYYEYIFREKRNIAEILFDFSSIKIDLEYLIECLGKNLIRFCKISLLLD
jgi:sulfite reductase alpha subunit-like flavoprotein